MIDPLYPPQVPDEIICHKCGIPKKATTQNFTAQSDCTYGLKKICKNCASERYEKPWVTSHRDSINQRNIDRYPSRQSYFANRYETERDSILAQQQIFKEEHPEIVKANKTRYRQTERGKERSIASEHNRRARKRSTGGSYTPQEIEAQYKRQKGKCYYCSKKIAKYHVEHVVPISRGGTNDISNIVLSCPSCNQKKGNRLPHEWPEGNRLL